LPRGLHAPTPFQSYSWLQHWLTHRAGNALPFVLLANDGATVGPFAIVRSRGARVLELIGSGDSDFATIASSRPADVAWDAVMAQLARRRNEWDVLHLHSVAERDVVLGAIRRHLSSGYTRLYELCPTITIRGTWKDFLARESKIRREVKRWAKRLEETGKTDVDVHHPPLSDSQLADLVEVERHSWKWTHGDAALREGTQREFLFAVLRDPDAPVRVWTLRVGGTLVAFAILLVDAQRWYYYMPSYRSDYRNAGALLLARIVERAHDVGCSAVSLLRGDHGYKEDWTRDAEAVYEIVCASSLRGRIAVAGYRLRWWAASKPMMKRVRSRFLRLGDRR